MAFTSSGTHNGHDWFAPHTRRENQTSVLTSAELQSLQHGHGRKRGILNSVVITLGPAFVLAAKVGGRFSAETFQFLRGLAFAKMRGLPQVLQGRAHAGWVRRWSAMLGCTAARCVTP